ncbi:hypothetical protein M0802_016877 [Mischocyttarus mexicanus]|nr:hypothetical protein M0802_016877 [Mischocyttarus mexicanus]
MVNSRRKVKENSKQSERQGDSGSKKLFVWFSHGKLNDKTRFIQYKSLTLAVFVNKNIKRSRQGFLSEKLRSRHGFPSKKLMLSQNKVISREAKVRRSFNYGLVKVASGFSQHKVKENSKQSDKQRGIGSKKLLIWLSQGFLSEMLRKSQNKVLGRRLSFEEAFSIV